MGLVHVLALLDFEKVNGLEKVLVENSKLMGLPVKKKDNPCKGLFYSEGVTPAHFLVANDRSIALEKILEKERGFLELETKSKKSLLHYASQFCSYRSAKILLAKGADPNVQNDQGYTPLMTAVVRGCPGVPILLLEGGS